eukprot:5924602-Amphidinium_carterae.1
MRAEHGGIAWGKPDIVWLLSACAPECCTFQDYAKVLNPLLKVSDRGSNARAVSVCWKASFLQSSKISRMPCSSELI